MKYLTLILLSACSGCVSQPYHKNKFIDQNKLIRTTSYTHNEKDHYQYGKLTCLGTTLRHGEKVSAASDWSFLPVGTEFKIEGCDRTYIIEDIGSALVGTETVDIYTPCRRSMNKRGTRHVNITITKMGCYHKSLAILKPRTHRQHARRMVESLEDKI